MDAQEPENKIKKEEQISLTEGIINRLIYIIVKDDSKQQ